MARTHWKLVNGLMWRYYRKHLREVLPYADADVGNPLLWFGSIDRSRDIQLCGYRTYRELMAAMTTFAQ